jgi:EAL domain-containing protein (putative c-di-GMP-specific phosphodiesterase class I)/AmiR/NasT family two-component response regulator
MEHQATAPSVNEPSTIGWASILIVDDTPDNVALLERILSNAGPIRIRGFTDPVAAVIACEEDRPDLVLLDLHMPQLDAIGFMTRIRASLPDGAFLPVIVLTADVTDDARQRVLAAGAKDFLTKPFNVTEVLLRVRNMLDTAALYRQLEQHNAGLQAELDASAAAQRAAADERAAQEERIAEVLTSHSLRMHYQPIVDIASGATVGVEALARFTSDPPRPPNEWFAEAAAIGRGVDLELLAIEVAIGQIAGLPSGMMLSVNASPATVCSERLAELVQPWAGQVVIELTEHDRVDDYDALLRALAHLRGFGLRLAVDDTGAGYASLQHILRLGADILKLDIALTQGIDSDPVRRSLASALVTFSRDIGAQLVAEGVENAAELRTLQSLGVTWAQGYHLGRPAALPLALHPAKLLDGGDEPGQAGAI